MDTVIVTFRVDKDVKQQAEKLFRDLGLTMSTACNLFLRQAIVEQAIPFKITKKQEVQYMDRAHLDQLADQAYKANEEAYKKLAK